MTIEDERWEVVHLYAAFAAMTFCRRPVLVLLLAYVWESIEEILFDCCGLFDGAYDELTRHEVLTDSLVEDPTLAIMGIICAWALLGAYPSLKLNPKYGDDTFVLSALVVGFALVLSPIYVYTDDDDFPWGYVATQVIGLVFFLVHGAPGIFLAHSLVLVALPPLLVEVGDLHRLAALSLAAVLSLAASMVGAVPPEDLNIAFM